MAVLCRWKGKNLPQGPDFAFRYLGVHMTLNLCWDVEISRLTRKVHTWGSKVKRASLDPATAVTTVREELFPKLELGIQFARPDEKTCNSWTKTIIHTLLESSGISPAFAASIKTSAFCSLANIPDIWRRAQTIHMTELFIALNTEKCTSGATTRARFCVASESPK